MSLTYSGVEPQPSLAWQFDTSNVDSVTGLAPSSQVSPGPAQLAGSAALVTNAPTSNTAVYFPGTSGSYMNLGTSTPINFNLNNSNIFCEAWVYLNSFDAPSSRIIFHEGTGGLNWSFQLNSGTPFFSSWGTVNGVLTAFNFSGSSSASLTTWTHVAWAYTTTGTPIVYLNGVPSIGTPLANFIIGYDSINSTFIGRNFAPFLNGYIRDLRVVQGGVVPTTSFTPGAAPFSYALPSYVTGSGSVVFTLLGQFITYPTGKYGSAISIMNYPTGTPNTSTKYLLYPLTKTLDPAVGISVSFWINVNNLPATGQISIPLLIQGAGGPSLYFSFGTTSWSVVYYNGTLFYSTQVSQVLSSGWKHLVGVVANGYVTAYYNGTQSGTPTAYANPVALASQIQLGSNGGYAPTDALYDDLRIYNTALTATQVQSVYSSQGAPAPSRAMPLPQLAWDFQSSNVDYVNGLSPSYSTVSGALTNLPTFVSGKYNQAIRLAQTAANSGANTYVLWSLASSPISIDTTGITIACWVNWTTLPGSFVSMYDAFTNVMGITMTSTLTSTGRGFSGTQALTNATSNTATNSTGTWYHIALTYNSTSVILYKNGVGTTPVATGAPGVTITGIRIGSQANNIQGTYVGYACADCSLDDLRVYNTALTAAQVQSIYNQQGMPGRGALQNVVGSVKTAFTGTPLFTQLSPSAVASSVGAFSLRAVNGTSAKAVNVLPNAPLPPAFTAPTGVGPYTQSLTGYAFGASGTYIANNSTTTSQTIYPAWKAFDGDVNTLWYSGAAKYDTSTNNGAYLGAVTTTISGVATPGEWVDVQFPTAVSVYSYSLTIPVSAFSVGIYPKTFKIAGSNDGTTWNLIDAPANQSTYTTGVPVIFTLASPSAVYNRFRMCVSNIIGTTSSFGTGIGQWTLYGSNTSWNTDFYADRLGNLLTAPVVGQSLANWLGGATGYVTTWYDQSGAGNNATQATAANQPVIQKATKGPGYACVYTGNQWVSFGTLNTFTGTPFCISAVTTRTSNVSLNGITGWGDGFSGFNFAIFTLSATQDRFRSDFRKTTGLNASGAIPVYAAGEGALYPVCDYSSGFINRIYNKSSLLTTSGNGVDFLNTANTKTPSIGLAPASAPNCFYQGEIYEVIFFTKSLYDLDGTSTITQIYNNQVGIYGT